MPLLYGILLVNTLLLILQLSGVFHPLPLLAKYNEAVWKGQIWRLFTAVFVHTNFWHFLVNVFALYCFGSILEGFIGPWRLLLLYLVSGVIGNLFSLLTNPHPSTGASGAVFGLVGGLCLFTWQNRTHLPRRQILMLLLALIPFLLYNQIFGFSRQDIDTAAHLGGLAGGACLAWVMNIQVGRRPTLLSTPIRVSFFLGFLVLLSYCALQPNKDTWRWHLLSGDRELKAGKVHSALQEYQRARELDPARAEIYVRLAAVYTELGIYEKARGAWRTVLVLDPGNPTARRQVRRLDRKLGR